ncbi:MAG: fibronectin type III domain-containing protein [Leptospiraceae bacterium]|nr:fibronectin type III domain-containing protein [Leptospiraceae bacterium]
MSVYRITYGGIVLSILCALILSTAPLSAQNNDDESSRQVTLRWNPVNGAIAYLIQIRNADEEIITDERIQTTTFERQLEPGTYNYRVAAVNRFDRPGQWSNWLTLTVRTTSRPRITEFEPPEEHNPGEAEQRLIIKGKNFLEQTKCFLVLPGQVRQEVRTEYIDSSTLAVWVPSRVLRDGNYDVLIQNPRGLERRETGAVAIKDNRVEVPEDKRRPARDDEEEGETEGPDERTPSEFSGSWESLLPGVPSFQRGQTTAGTLWGVGFWGLGLLSGLEAQAASITRAEYNRTPYAQIFNSPLLLYYWTSNGVPTSFIAEWAVIVEQQRLKAEADFVEHRNRHYALAGLSVAAWVSHFIIENDDRFESTHLVPGVSFFKRGQGARGGAWVGAMVAVLGGIIVERQKTNESFRSYRRLDRNIVISPIFQAYALTRNNSTLEYLAYNGLRGRYIADETYSEYTLHRNNVNMLTGALAMIYLMQVVDATMSAPDPSPGPAPVDSDTIETSASKRNLHSHFDGNLPFMIAPLPADDSDPTYQGMQWSFAF